LTTTSQAATQEMFVWITMLQLMSQFVQPVGVKQHAGGTGPMQDSNPTVKPLVTQTWELVIVVVQLL
jgi:hypothetical protein